jgi:hypothetical protein
VGKFDVRSVSFQGGHLVLEFGADGESGTLEAESKGESLTGKFVFGADSGPTTLVRGWRSKAGWIR